ncbi:hypothetical protein [Streptomyces sp. NPDC059378]|uniref:hypothetical protein n=1 Tax=Streptomyces sp. NPDC059378 TaxID=3346815 RepID=UPI0036A173B7
MRRPGPALRVALLGFTVTVVGYALFAGWLGGHAFAYEHARDRATAKADGLIVEDGIGDDEDIRVRWTDTDGHAHVQRFGIYDTDRYTEGRHFEVVYDPAEADPQGFPADPDETAAEDDRWVPAVLGGAVLVPLGVIWLWRGLRFRLAARRPGRPMTATVRRGERLNLRNAFQNSNSTWLVLSVADSPGPADRPEQAAESGHPEHAEPTERWQRVMWHPALDELRDDPAPVTVHARGSRPAVVRLSDGTRLVPLGRLHREPPKNVFLDDHEVGRLDLRDAFVRPAGAELRPARAWWWPGAGIAALGTVLGVFGGFLMGGGTLVAVVGFALFVPTLLTSVWALSAPQP